MFKVFFLALFVLSLAFSAAAQQPSATPPDDQVVRISTNLIQIDVTVTDKNGKVVTGLTADDFEIFENGERQRMSNFSFVSRTASGAVLEAAKTGDAKLPPGTSPQLHTSAGVRSTIAMVVDDLNMSFASIYYARKALKRFVDQQMQPGDSEPAPRQGRKLSDSLRKYIPDVFLRISSSIFPRLE